MVKLKYIILIILNTALIYLVLSQLATTPDATIIPKLCILQGNQKPEDILESIMQCSYKPQKLKITHKSDFIVFNNYIIQKKKFACFETITYRPTTHGDYTFLDNLEPLLERWRGPVSVALNAPGEDFQPTIEAIRYLLQCGSSLVAKYVTFHIYFLNDHLPKSMPKAEEFFNISIDCSEEPIWTNVTWENLYNNKQKLLYPVNVGRNIARDNAVTHYILAFDIELYPNPGLITDFLDLVRRQEPVLLRENPKIFPLAIFEVQKDVKIPNSKTELVSMLNSKKAIVFHKSVCKSCHSIPNFDEWKNTSHTELLQVFHICKRTGAFKHWEPIYISTHDTPLYDERLSWNGRKDKMTQGYIMCVQDYEFLILNNAFIVHKPGIKKYVANASRSKIVSKTNKLISSKIGKELAMIYGKGKGCAI